MYLMFIIIKTFIVVSSITYCKTFILSAIFFLHRFICVADYNSFERKHIIMWLVSSKDLTNNYYKTIITRQIGAS